jgi:hypothetical protein
MTASPPASLPPAVEALLARAKAEDATGWAKAAKLGVTVVPVLDGATYLLDVAARAPNEGPVVVTIHGSGVHAHAGVNAWAGHLTAGRVSRVISIQWWIGAGNASNDYLSVEQLEVVLSDLDRQYGSKIVLHGFSRGSTRVPALLAATNGDITRGICDSGALAMDAPFNAEVRRYWEADIDIFAGYHIVVVSGLYSTSTGGTRAEMKLTNDLLRSLGAATRFSTDDSAPTPGATPEKTAANGHGYYVRSRWAAGDLEWLTAG